MKKISKKSSYIVVGILTLVGFIFDLLFNKDLVIAEIYLLATFIVIPTCVYVMYLFVRMKKRYAYLHSVIGTILVYIGSFWSIWPEARYYFEFNDDYVPESFITFMGMVDITFLGYLVFWGFVYLIISYVSKRKCKEKAQ